MEHDQTICPRCGEPTSGFGFCQPCRSQIDSLKAAVTPGAAAVGEPTRAAAQVLQEVVRLEQALAATSKGISDRIAARTSAGAVQAPDATSEPVETPARPSAPEREVARLEDVLTVAPSDTEATAPAVEPAPATEASEPTPKATPSYVAAQALREAFWFEQASAFKPAVDGEPAPRPVPAPAPAAPDVAPVQHAEPPAQPEDPPSVAQIPADDAPERHWLAAVCLLALIAVLIAVTGRAPRRGNAS